MDYHLVNHHDRSFIELLPAAQLANTRDALDWIALCGEYRAGGLLVYSDNLSPAFFDLRSGMAGEILLKFVVYHVKVAAVLSAELVGNGRFSEMVRETNRGAEFRVFYNREQAAAWLGAGPNGNKSDKL